MTKQQNTLTRAALSLSDPACKVVVSDTYVYRAIHSDYVAPTHSLLASGLLDDLYERELIPHTQVATITLPGYKLVLEQTKIEPIIYPYEWSPEMLRHAALCMLEVNQCTNQFGYELKDAQPFNIVFRHKHPFFVDIGSFIKQATPRNWCAREEFDACFSRILDLAQKGCLSFFKHAFLLQGAGFNAHELTALKHPLMAKLLGLDTISLCLQLASMYRIGPTISDQAIRAKFRNAWLHRGATFILHAKLLPFRSFSHNHLKRSVTRYKLGGKSAWGNYHRQAGLCNAQGDPTLSDRMTWVLNMAQSLVPKSVLELAGNQGVLSRALASALPADTQIICSDYDPYAIDHLYLNLRPEEQVLPACFDFMRDARESITQERAKRLKSDLVIALAVTHHLVLTQSFSLDSILFTLHSYTRKHLIVEFMPLGLWDGTRPVAVPEWYHETWFTSTLERYFHIETKTQLEKNRIIFVGHKKTAEGCVA